MTMNSVGTSRWNTISKWAPRSERVAEHRGMPSRASKSGRALGSLLGAVGLCLLSGSAFAQATAEPPAAAEPASPQPAPADPNAAPPAAGAPAAGAPAPAPIDPNLDPNNLEPGGIPGLGSDASLEPGPAPGGKGGMDEVVVTVDRRVKNLQTYSGTASAFTENQLTGIGITNVRELASVVPGLQIGTAEGNTEVYIRGIGSDNDTELGDEAVALHLDGVYLPRPRGVGSMFYDIERVEVNSGPQGTLRGRNAVGGTVNIVSNKPKLGEFGANADATFGTYAERRYSGMVNIPIGDTVAFRFAGYSEVHDPYFHNGGPFYDITPAENADNYAFRAQMKWKPNKAFDALLAYDYTAERGTGYLGSDFNGALTRTAQVGDDPNNTVPNPVDISNSSIKDPRSVYYRGMQPSMNLKHWGTRLELTYDTGPVLLQALGSYRDLKFNEVNGSNAGLAYPGFNYTPADTLNLQDNYSSAYWHTTSRSEIAELRVFAPDTARFRWTLGGFFFNEKQYAFLGQTSDYVNGYGGGEFNMPDVKGGSLAGYADGTFDVTSKWRLIAGARVTHESKSRDNGLWAQWSNFSSPNGPMRFGTEGFKYAGENRTIFTLSPNSTVTQRVNAFLNGIQSFGARDTVPQYLCADPPTAQAGQTQQQRVIPNGTGGLQCSNGVNPALLNSEQAYNADPTNPNNSKPFNINIIPQNNKISDNFFDWRVGTEFDVAKENMLYATVTTAHKAGGFNDTTLDPSGQPLNPPLYKPESIISFEVGSKNMFLDRHLKLNASAFVYRYTDMVFQTIVTVTPDDPTQPGDQSSSAAVRQNAASATIYGLDADFIYSLPLGLEAEVHALALDARFGSGTIVNDSRIGYDVPSYKVDIGGNWLPRASPISLNYTLSQFLPTSVGIFHWLVSAQTVAKHYMSVFNGHGNVIPQVGDAAAPTTSSYTNLLLPGGADRLTDVVPTYTRFDIGAGWKHPDSRLAIEGYVNNVGNIYYATTVISTPGLNLRFFNPPRTAGIRVRVDW